MSHSFSNVEDTTIVDAVVVTSVLAPGTFPAPQRQHQGFFKLNHRFNDRNGFDARYSFNRNTQEGQTIGGLNTYDRRGNTQGRPHAFIASPVSNFRANKSNQTPVRSHSQVV